MRARRTVLALAAVLALGACGGSGGSDSGAPDAQSGEAKPGAQQALKGLPGRAAPEGADSPAALARAVIRTATVRVRVADVPGARAAAVAAAERSGGLLEGEESRLDEATILTLRVPPGRFEALLADLGRLGKVEAQNISTEDVTEDVADVEGRLAAMRASTARLRRLMARAGSVTDIAAVEREVSQREEEIESLESRRRAIRGETSMATVTATLSRPPVAAAAARAKPEVGGFGGGLRVGWLAFTRLVSVLLIVTGALLPFAVATALVAGPTVLYVRRRRGRYSASTP